MKLTELFKGAIAAVLFLGLLYAAAKLLLKAYGQRRGFTKAENLILQYPPPDGFNPGDCVAVPVKPEDPNGYVKYVLIQSYSILNLPMDGVERVWMLYCDDGCCYPHTRVTRVPGGMPDGNPSTANPEGLTVSSPPM